MSYIPYFITSIQAINGLATGSTLLYTNNSGKTLIVSDVALFATTATTITSGPTAQIGSTSTGSDIYGSEVITALNTLNAVYHFGGPGMSKVIPNTGTLYLDITAAGVGTGTPVLTLEAVVSGVFV